MDYAALAKQFGAVGSSAAQPADWMGGLSQKDQAELKMKMYQDGLKRISDLNAKLEVAGKNLSDMQEFGRLNRETATGSFLEQVIPDDWKFLHGDNINEMNAIQSRLAPSQREPGSGSTTDADIRLFLRALPSTTNKGNVNKGIREDYERNLKFGTRKRDAMQQYLNQHGSLNNFDQYWDSINKPAAKPTKAPAGAFADPEKERRYQEWKRSQGK